MQGSLFPKRLSIIAICMTVLSYTLFYFYLFQAKSQIEETDKFHFSILERSSISVRTNSLMEVHLKRYVKSQDLDDLEGYLLNYEIMEYNNEFYFKLLEEYAEVGLRIPVEKLKRVDLGRIEEQILSLIEKKQFNKAKQLFKSSEYQNRLAEYNESHALTAEKLSVYRDEKFGFNKILLNIVLTSSLVLLVLVTLLWFKVVQSFKNNLMFKEQAESQLEEERLKNFHNHKLAVMGEMAGGIGHEINNPLAIIQGTNRIILKLTEKDPLKNKQKIIDSTVKIKSVVERITKIIRNLRDMSRDTSEDPMEKVQFSEILEYTLEVSNLKKANSDVQSNLVVEDGVDLESLFTFGRKIEIEQVLINIINNAFDAVEASEEKEVKILVSADDDNIFIDVKDSGPGIPEDVRDKIFQPFFTTKDVGKGTGMGLSISSRIIRNNGGELLVHSYQPTIFRVKIKRFKEDDLADSDQTAA